jgi:DNA polymerase epsilon subunit 3
MPSDSPEEASSLASAAKDDDEDIIQPNQPPPSPNASNKPDNLPTAVEFEPPLACVRRILKNTLPSSTNVGKDASQAFARATGIFIIYLTSCANDFARENKRQTITANDVLAATKELDFEDFLPEMTSFLDNYRAMEKSKKDAKAKAAADKAGKQKDNDGDDADEDDNDSHDETDEQDGLKRRYEEDGAEIAEGPSAGHLSAKRHKIVGDLEINRTILNDATSEETPSGEPQPATMEVVAAIEAE